MGKSQPVCEPLAVSFAEAARIVGVARSTLYERYIATNKIPTFRIGRRRLIKTEDLRAFVATLPAE